ncbi:hypothetical protein RRG08_065123 [Elysia crispata]|uniref:Uncharacterized protein n=1 Tax=Elysia crispata TaxID=231223 RepID=A0AAE0Z9P1_9GAST|nr:hypothetical protein RRG08_065123 [Elysia crispata]
MADFGREGEEEVEDYHIRFREDEEMEFFTELALHETERWIQRFGASRRLSVRHDLAEISEEQNCRLVKPSPRSLRGLGVAVGMG